jgi:hypothetical protein
LTHIPTLQEKPVAENHCIIEAIDDDARSGPARGQIERGWRNLNWLTANWATLLPQAQGRFVAVAGQESFLADSAVAAWAWAKSDHPNDDGAIVQYVRQDQGPRIYLARGAKAREFNAAV